MVNIDTRKCNFCKQPIEIHKNNPRGVVYYKKLYYHTACFCEMAERKSLSANGTHKEWQDALNNVSEYEHDAREIVRQRWGDKQAKVELNEYLLSQYNVAAVDNTRFWQGVASLSKGMYKKKCSKRVSTQTLLEAWKWGQQKLDEINKYNKMHNKGPKNDNERIPYDFAIIVKKIPEYLAYKAKQEAAELERQQNSRETIKIDYNKIKAPSKKSGLGDISDLIDELIGL